MAGIGEAASIIAIIQITQSIFELCSDYYGAVKDAESEIRRLQDELIGLHEVLQKVQKLFENDLRKLPFPISREFKQALENCRSLVDELKNRLETKKDHFFARLVHRGLQWPFTRKELDLKLQHLHTVETSLAAILAIEQTAVSVKILERVDYREKVDILDWISSVPYGEHHASIKDARVECTCEWLLQHDKFAEWINAKSSVIMWLYGSPGAGKTFLASKVIDEIDSHFDAASNQGFAFFYCKRTEAGRHEPLSVLRSYVRQLSSPAGNSERIRGRVRDLYREKKLKGSELGLELCKEQILESVNLYDRTTLVLDALDECDRESRTHLLDMVEKLLHESTKPIRIFISSRPDGDLRTRFENKPNIELQAELNQDDIQQFVQSEIVKHPRWKDMPSSLKDDIIEVLQERSDGMFQWADLQIKQLLELYTEEAIRDRLGTLPDTLEMAYSEIYGRIKDKNDKITLDRALKWVACAFEPLTSDMLLSAICLGPFDTVRSKITESALLDLGKNLLVLDSKLNVWRFSHLSVTEYFEKNHWGQESAHCFVAKVCLRLLIDTYTKEFYNELLLVKARSAWNKNEQSSIREYARAFWVKHVQTQEGQKVDFVLAVFLKIFLGSPEESSTQYRAWTLEISKHLSWSVINHSVESFDSHASFPTKRSILAMCYFSFYTLLQDWWESAEIHISEMTDIGENVLCIAAKAGNRKICEVLIRRGMNVDQPDEWNGSALAAAAGYGSIEIVRYLVEQGADVNQILQAGYGSALAAAAAGHDIEIVQYLVEQGADVNQILQAGDYGSALAAAGHDIEIVQYLVEQDADVNQILQTGLYGSALAAAAEFGSIEIVQYLIEQGADVNQILQTGYGSALASAAATTECESVEIVQYLIEQGADVNQILQTGLYGSALAAAAGAPKFDSFEIVQYLVEQGADVNQILQAGDYGSALAAAAGYGSIEIVQYLVEQRADVNQILQTGLYGSALSAASADDRNIEILKYLIEKGADVNMMLENVRYGSALATAAHWGNQKCVETLIRAGAEVNLKLTHGEFRTALHAAQKDITREDIERRYGFSRERQERLNAGKLKVVELLLDCGAVEEE